MQHVAALHAVVVGQAVADGVHPDMAHVQPAGGVWEHGQDVELVAGRRGGWLQGNAKCR